MQNKMFEDFVFYHRKLSKTPDYVKLYSKDPEGKKFKHMRGCSGFVDSFFTLEHFDDPYGYETISIVVGINETAKKENLNSSDLQKIVTKVSDGSLKILNSHKNIHSKIYILWNEKWVRVIIGSNNITKRAKSRHQEEDCSVADFQRPIHEKHEYLQSVKARLESFEKHADLFMEDLINLIKDDPEKTQEISRNWLEAVAVSQERISLAKHNKIILSAIDSHPEKQEVIKIAPSKIPQSVRKKFSKNKAITIKEDRWEINKKEFLSFKQNSELPAMMVDFDKETAKIGKDGNFVNRVADTLDKQKIKESLSLIEDFINQSIDKSDADCIHPNMTKHAYAEFLLHMLFGPFVSEWARRKKEYGGFGSKKGPKMVIIQGPSNNGKSTFANWGLSLVYGDLIKPIMVHQFSGPEIETIIDNQILGKTTFPLILDDPRSTFFKSGGPYERITKNHWDPAGHLDKIDQPNLIWLANEPKLHAWGKSRIDVINIDIVYHNESNTNIDIINTAMAKKCDIFPYFSKLVFTAMAKLNKYEFDDLYIPRKVWAELYNISNMPIPEWAPMQQYSKKYDQGKIKAKKILFDKHLKLSKVISNDPRIIEIPDYKQNAAFIQSLPQHINAKKHGARIEVLNPREFDKWIGRAPPPTLVERVKSTLTWLK